MKSTRPTDLHALLRLAGVRPSRKLGQNFLIDENIARIVLDAADIAPGREILEIGPGAGALTEGLLARGARALAVEKDARLAALLRRRWPGDDRIEILAADALELPVRDLLRGGAIRAVISNLPYSDGARILIRLATSPLAPTRMVVMLQTEVARRLEADPGSPRYGLLAIWTRRLYAVKRLHIVPPDCFYPRPKIESTLLRLTLLDRPLAEIEDPDRHRAFSRWVFQSGRKQLGRILAHCPSDLGGPVDNPGPWLAKAGIPPTARPGDLSIEQWAVLSNRIRTG